jgi:hypothetical protein
MGNAAFPSPGSPRTTAAARKREFRTTSRRAGTATPPGPVPSPLAERATQT